MEVNIGGRRKVKFQDNKEDVIQEDMEEMVGGDDVEGENSEDNLEEGEESEEEEDDHEEEDEEEENEEEEEENEEEEEENEEEEEEEDDDDDESLSLGKRKSEDKTIKPAKKLKTLDQPTKTISDINAAILQEIGGSASDGDSDEDIVEGNDADLVKSDKSAEVRKSSNSVKSGRFHHRLTTDKDTEAHNKVTQALSKINHKQQMEDEDESEEVEDEDETKSDEENESEMEGEEGSGSRNGKFLIKLNLFFILFI